MCGMLVPGKGVRISNVGSTGHGLGVVRFEESDFGVYKYLRMTNFGLGWQGIFTMAGLRPY